MSKAVRIPAKVSILHNDDGTWRRDDAQLRDGLIELAECVRLVGCAWEMFPNIERRRDYMDPIYKRLGLLVEELKQIDQRKGELDVPA